MTQRPLLAVLLTTLALTAGAEDAPPPPEFDVEIIVFRHLAPDESELPPLPPVAADSDAPDAADGPDPTEPPAPEPEAEAEPEIEQSFAALPADRLRLQAIHQRLLRSRDWSPVLHYGWRQATLGRADAQPIAVAGNRLGAYLAGTVRVSLERFLRLEFELEMDPGTGIAYTLDQARRIRSGNLHYFDHPQFGVIALVSRTDTDE